MSEILIIYVTPVVAVILYAGYTKMNTMGNAQKKHMKSHHPIIDITIY